MFINYMRIMEERRGVLGYSALQPFIHQVGGHSSIQQFDQNTVGKPLFSKELRFYEEVCSAFKPFIPKFKGVVTVKELKDGENSVLHVVSSHAADIKLHHYRYGKHCTSCSCHREGWDPKTVKQEDESSSSGEECQMNSSALNNDNHGSDDSSLEYILLENVVGRYKNPCILDLKMGTEKHKDYTISKEEADRRQARWDQTTSKSLGVRVCGMKVYLVNKRDFFVMAAGRDLSVDGFRDAIKTFLYNGERSRLDVIDPYLKQLGELLSVIEDQSSYRFYNTSLLLIYEGEECENTEGNIGHDDCSSTVKDSHANVCIRMIDFAHAHYNNQSNSPELHNVPDNGYLFGLRSVIRILKETLEELQTEQPSS